MGVLGNPRRFHGVSGMLEEVSGGLQRAQNRFSGSQRRFRGTVKVPVDIMGV